MKSPEQNIFGEGVFVEKAHVGDTELVVALCAHSAENMHAIVNKLRDCPIIAMEYVGAANAQERHKKEEAYTRLTDPQLDQQMVRESLEPFKSDTLGALSYELVGMDKQVVLLDINADHPDFHKVSEGVNKQNEFIRCLSDVAPIEETTRTLSDAVVSFAESDAIREGIQAEQLAELSKKVGDTKVGVILGASHMRAIDAVADRQGDNSENRKKITDVYLGFHSLVDKYRNGEEIDEELLHKTILEEYLRRATSKDKASVLMKKMDNDMMARVLDGINHIAKKDEASLEKWREATAYMDAVADIVEGL